MIKVSILSFFIALFSWSLNSQTHIWTGNGNGGSWDDTNNWDTGTVPDATSDVLIPDGFGVTIENSTASANSIEILGDSGLAVFYDLNIASQLTITSLATLRFFNGIISGGGSIDNLGFIELLGPDLKEFSNIVINNHHILWVQLSNQIHVKDNTIFNNFIDGEMLIASVGGFLNQGTSATLNNSGLLRKLNDGVNPFGNYYLIMDINNTGTIQVDEDETFLILGGNIHLNNLETGVIQGFGTLDITADFDNQGTIAPGTIGSVGTLHITNNFEVGNNGILDVDITGSDSGDYDHLDNFGSPILEGSFEINLEFEASIGDEFTVITGTLGISTCNFPQYTSASYMGVEYTFETICNSNDVVLKVVEKILDYDDLFHQKYEMVIQPNPVKENAQLIIPNFKEIPFSSDDPFIRVYNSLGQLVAETPIDSETTLLNLSELASGFYYLKLMDGNDTISNLNILVE